MNEQVRIDRGDGNPVVQNVAVALAGPDGDLVRTLCVLGGDKLTYEGPGEQVIVLELVEEADGA